MERNLNFLVKSVEGLNQLETKMRHKRQGKRILQQDEILYFPSGKRS